MEFLPSPKEQGWSKQYSCQLNKKAKKQRKVCVSSVFFLQRQYNTLIILRSDPHAPKYELY